MASRQFIYARQYFLDAHLLPAMERVRRIAPGASQVATRQTHEDARQARARAFTLNRLENFRDNHDFGVRRLACPEPRRAAAFPAPSIPCGSLPFRICLPPCPARQPVNHTEEKNHRDNQPRISWRYSHGPQYHNVARCHEQRWDHDNEKRSIHRLTRFPNNYAPGRYCARLVSVSHKMTSVTRAPGGKSFNCRLT